MKESKTKQNKKTTKPVIGKHFKALFASRKDNMKRQFANAQYVISSILAKFILDAKFTRRQTRKVCARFRDCKDSLCHFRLLAGARSSALTRSTTLKFEINNILLKRGTKIKFQNRTNHYLTGSEGGEFQQWQTAKLT